MITTLRVRIRDRESRKYFGAYLGAKMIGVAIVVLGMYGDRLVLQYQGGRGDQVRAGGAASEGRRCRQPAQHGVGPGDGLPGVLHAGRVHDARGRVRENPGSVERHALLHRRHVHVRPALLGVRLRVHVRDGERLDRQRVLLPARRADDLRVDRGGVPRVLPVPVRVRRHVQHDHDRFHGRAHRVRRGPDLQHRGERVHLPDHRPLGMGSRRLARHDGYAVP